ncbi:hypothetical protein [Catenovulum agarivorans]|uniref:hypothetical protein n=1 Tax=Catenovulum agarivorans TaxID=1172192 RepID=UPI0002DDFAFC|nr:hypothetical protein [Catenovulum agarivorans]
MAKVISEKDQHWLAFIRKDRIFSDATAEVQNQLTQLPYLDAQSYLKTQIDEASFKKLNGRFRAYLHRLKSGKSTLTVDSYILHKLDAMKNAVSADDYSDLLEYLLKPDGAYSKELSQFHANYTNTQPKINSTQDEFSQLFKSLYPHHQTLIKAVLEATFLQGVSVSRTTRSMDKIEQVCNEHLNSLIFNLERDN